MTSQHVTQAIVLVGGKGTRLGELTASVPKPLLEIAPGMRFLDALLAELARHGFLDIVLLAGHLGDQVQDAYHGRRVWGSTVRVVREPSPQGTGGALRFAADILAPWFLMANGDSLFEINFRELAARPSKSMIGRLALREVADPARYGSVRMENGRITAFEEKNRDLKAPALINGGVYVLSRDILQSISGPSSIEADVFPVLAASGKLEGLKFDGYFLDIGLPDTFAQAQREIPSRRFRPCVFLDRDGVINVDEGHTYRPDALRFIEGAPQAIRNLNDAGYYVIVVSNQAGVARGHYTERDVFAFHAEMARRLGESGGHVDAFYFCPFHPEGIVPEFRAADHPDRKPNPGMILRALKEWPIQADRSFLIGDKASDLEAATAAGLRAVLYEEGRLDTLVETALAG